MSERVPEPRDVACEEVKQMFFPDGGDLTHLGEAYIQSRVAERNAEESARLAEQEKAETSTRESLSYEEIVSGLEISESTKQQYLGLLKNWRDGKMGGEQKAQFEETFLKALDDYKAGILSPEAETRRQAFSQRVEGVEDSIAKSHQLADTANLRIRFTRCTYGDGEHIFTPSSPLPRLPKDSTYLGY